MTKKSKLMRGQVRIKNGKPTITDDKIRRDQNVFLATFVTCGTISATARAAGILKDHHYDWLKNDAEYVKRFAAARVEANETLEREAIRRAVDGVLKIKFHRGQPIIDPRTITAENPKGEPYYELEYSDTLLIFLLKGNMPDKYKDRIEQQQTGTLRVIGQDREELFRQAVERLQQTTSEQKQLQ